MSVAKPYTIFRCCLIWGTLVGMPFGAAGAGVTAIDDRGRAIELQRPAQRLISLAPHVTELLFAVGAGDQVVAVSEFSDYPPAARRLPRVASAVAIDYERVAAFDPDLVVAWLSGNGRDVIDRLEQLGFAVFATEPRTFSDVERTLLRLGRITGHEQQSVLLAEQFSSAIQSLQSRYRDKQRVSVFYQVSQRPLITLNDQHLVSQMLAVCGGENAFGAYKALAPTINIEDVLRKDADMMLISSTIPKVQQVRARWMSMRELKAARTGHIFIVDADLVNRQTPRLVKGTERICELIHAARSG